MTITQSTVPDAESNPILENLTWAYNLEVTCTVGNLCKGILVFRPHSREPTLELGMGEKQEAMNSFRWLIKPKPQELHLEKRHSIIQTKAHWRMWAPAGVRGDASQGGRTRLCSWLKPEHACLLSNAWPPRVRTEVWFHLGDLTITSHPWTSMSSPVCSYLLSLGGFPGESAGNPAFTGSLSHLDTIWVKVILE